MTDPTHKFLSVEQAAEQVGVGPSTIRQWIRRGHLHAVRVRRRVFVRELDLLTAERNTRHRGGTRTPQ